MKYLILTFIFQFDDGFMDDRNVLDDLHSDLLERHHHNAMEFTSALLGQVSY